MSTPPSPPVVLIVGCGVAGPVLGIFFKRKGYTPIVFDKVRKLGDAGASLMLMSNGLKVLNLVGLADAVTSESKPITALRDATADGTLLGHSDLPGTFPQKYGQPCAGIKRTWLNLALKQRLLDLGIEFREGWELTGVREGEDSVMAVFGNGHEVTGSFLVGCDGLKSATRAALLELKGMGEEGLPTYTGLTQTAGISETPAGLLGEASAMRNYYGDGVHVITYPVSPTHTSWAVTQRESQETAESWRPCTPDELPRQKQDLQAVLGGWNADVLGLVGSAGRIIKFGLFDRGELRAGEWYSRRCVLVGDAAHPTSPHLGQGANQALEDCFHLSNAMPSLDPESADYQDSLAILGPGLADAVFKPFAEKRQPRTSTLVKGARAQGDSRVAAGPEAGRERDEAVRKSFEDPTVIEAKYRNLLIEPFQDL